MDAEEIHDAPDQMVPRRLYLPDGRMVPTCVVYAPPLPVVDDEQAPLTLSFPSDLFGGGYVCLTEVQGRQRVGTIACMVTDGVRTYALTNRHVAGLPGQAVTSLVGGVEVPLGVAAGRSVGRVAFEHAYPGLTARRAEIAVDAGLIDIADLTHWTTQVFGIGQLGPVVDLGPETVDLRLVGQPVKAFGGRRYPPAPATRARSGPLTTTPVTTSGPPGPTAPPPSSCPWPCNGADTGSAAPPRPASAPRPALTPW